MLRNRKVRHAALAGSLAVALVTTGIAAAPAVQAGSIRHKVFHAINRIRANHGLDTLTLNRPLSEDAKAHTRKMIKRGELFDPRNLTELLEPYDWDVIGADVVGCRPTVHKIMRQWMSEKIHRSIILHPALERAGIGAIATPGKTACGRDQIWTTAIMYG
ncbi:MAG TPA: CAP domain-containing protein [Actinomycetota bacterium]|nr:CAP domain-containing protein [Actinomycetota bacterium]